MKRWWSVLVVSGLLVLPLLAAGAFLHRNDRWAPVSDLAMIETRVRDVGTIHAPLLGLQGRLGRASVGSHPGPLAFYLLWPGYRLLGGSYWALRASMIALNGMALVSALVLAERRGGAPSVLGAGLGIAWLELGFGPVALTEPWNPYLPVVWFIPFLLAVWSVLAGDLAMLAVAAATGSLCAQTHIPYLAVAGGLGLSAALSFGVRWVRAARLGLPQRDHARALAATALVLGVLWAPPLIEQWTHHPGNVSVLVDYFAHPPTAMLGATAAQDLLLARLDAWHLSAHAVTAPGIFLRYLDVPSPSPARGAVFLGLWLVAALFGRTLGSQALSALHGTVAAAVVSALVAMARIIGPPVNYLLYSVWSIDALMLLAIGWTVGLGAWRWLPERRRPPTSVVGAVGLLAIAACAARLALQAGTAGASSPRPLGQLAELAPKTVDALERRVGGATGRDGRYLVTWSEAIPNGQGFGLVNELERRGFRVGVRAAFGMQMTPHRVLDPRTATACVHLATGSWIRDAKHTRGATEVAFSDPRLAGEREEYSTLRTAVARALRAMGRKDAATALDWNILLATSVPGVHPLVHLSLQRMSDIGVPAAVFIEPVTPD